MGLDPLSFMLGFGSASGMSYAMWRNRERIARLNESTGEGVGSIREMFNRSADSRYLDELTDYLEGYHLAKEWTPLTDVLVEPRLLTAMRAPEEFEDANANPDNYDYVIPRVYDFPQLLSSYYVDNLPLTDIVAGDKHVAILGRPGSGKSTAMATIGLMVTGAVSFTSLQSMTDQAMEEALADLDEEDRDEARREMQEIQQRFMEKLENIETDLTNFEELQPPPPLTDFFPIFVPMHLIDLDLNIYGTRVDPAEPLIRAFQQYASLINSRSAPPMMYQKLNQGKCLILLDGFEDLPETDRTRLYGWLENLLSNYGHNRIIITGPTTSYDPLLALGFTPTFIKPFAPAEIDQFVDQWSIAWPKAEQRRAGKRVKEDADYPPLAEDVVMTLKEDTHHRTPFELTIKLLAQLGGSVATTEREWITHYTDQLLPEEREHTQPLLREVVMFMLNRDAVLKRDQIVEMAEKRLVPNEEEPPLLDVGQFTKALFESGVFTESAADSFIFRHRLIRDYFGGESIIHDMTPARMAELGAEPTWHYAFRYAASGTDIAPAVGKKLSSSQDILLSNVFAVSDWLPDAPEDAVWRGEMMKRFGAVLLSPSQFRTLRERAMSALLASRDPNVKAIFRQAVRSGKAVIRKYGILGLGAINAADTLNDLRPMLADDVQDVRVAAGLALGAIGDENALKIMIEGLLQGSEGLRQVIAQALANVPGEGHEILRDAIVHEEMMVRRAAVYGLARVSANWALMSLYEAMTNDGEWYVRSSAESQFLVLNNPEREGPRAQPKPGDLKWFRAWSENVGIEEFPEDEHAADLLIQVLRDPRAKMRMMGAKTLGLLGVTKSSKALYALLMDKESSVRTEAYDALGYLQYRMNERLPAII